MLCPHVPNPDQLDTGSVHVEGPDGIGDTCHCGEVTANGIVNGQDGMFVTRRALGLETGGLFANSCPNYTGGWQIEVQTDGLSNVTLTGLRPGEAVALDGGPAGSVDPDGTATLLLAPGQHTIGILPGP